MDDTSIMIYNELVELRTTFKDYADKMEARVSSLEQFKNYLLGVVFMVGIGVRCAWDYVKERIF